MLTKGQQVQAGIISAVATPLIRGLCRTLTWEVEGDHYYDEILRSGKQPIIAFWHGRILSGLYHFKDRGIVVITSQNFDGEWIARIIKRFGYDTARGSTSRGGARALTQMRRDLARGRAVAFTVDGPRGPAHVVQPGAIWLAGSTGNPILPFHIEADRFWCTSSWDRSQIPKPFSRIALAIGSPIVVRGTEPGTLRDGCTRLADALRALEARATVMARP
jgi:lysophospholipid acyltransferase (LPLAT)-like uncharacterized protein